MDTVAKYFRIEPQKIVILKSLLEGHEGFLVVRTIDPKDGIIQLLVSPDYVEEVESVLSEICTTIWMEAVPEPSPAARRLRPQS